MPAITGLGLERLLWRAGGRNRIILCYHGATRHPDFKINGRHISCVQLEEHFRYFKKHFEVVPVAEFFNNPGHRPERAQLAVTFDDGFRNNFTEVLPVMQRFDVPASFYITTGCLSDPEFLNWADMLEVVLYGSTEQSFEFNSIVFHRANGLRSAGGENLFAYIKSLGDERDIMLKNFAARYGYSKIKSSVPPDYFRMLSADELVAFASSPLVEIGSHTVRHYNLSNISEELAADELATSKRQLENVLGRTIDSIAYPDGSYNERVKVLSREAGYTKLLAVQYKCSSDPQDRDILPRFTVSNTTTFSSNMIRMSRQAKFLAF